MLFSGRHQVQCAECDGAPGEGLQGWLADVVLCCSVDSALAVRVMFHASFALPSLFAVVSQVESVAAPRSELTKALGTVWEFCVPSLVVALTNPSAGAEWV